MLRAFSLVEVLVVVVIIGILAAVVVPRFAGATAQAQTGATESALGSVRASIANFRARQALAGGDPYPTLAQLTTRGTVLQQEMPANPFNGSSAVQTVTFAQASARAVANLTQFGWNYHVDNAANPPVAIFYANSTEPTTTEDSSGDPVPANEL